MVTTVILHLTKVTFLDADWYLFRVVTDNRYLFRGSSENALFIIAGSLEAAYSLNWGA